MQRWGAPTVVALAAANVALFLAYVATARYTAPFMDGVYFLHDALTGRAGLWDRFGEQRPVAMRLLSWIDLDLFAASGDLFVAVSLVALAAILAVVVLAPCRLPGPPGLRVLAGALAVVLCCRCYTLESYIWSHGVQFVLVAAASAGALAVAALADRPGRPLPLAVAGTLSVLAVLSYGNGVLTLPLLAWIAWLRRAPARGVALLAVVAAAILAGVAFDARPVAGQSDPAAALAHPAAALDYMIHFLGSPWSRGGPASVAGLVLGAAILLVGVWIAVALVRSRAADGDVDGIEILCGALLGFAILSALMTALARIDFGPEQAVQSRYGPFAMLGHAAAALFVLKRLAVAWTRPVLAGGVVAAIIAFLAAVPVEQVLAGELFRWQARTLDEVALALQAGSREDSRLRQIYPQPELARATLDAAKSRGVSLYRGAPRLVGQTLVETGLAAQHDACDGAIEGVWRRAGSEWELDGWARDARTGALPHAVVVADAAGRIVGYGRLDRLRRELSVKFGWHAIAVPGGPVERWTVVALLSGGGACRIIGP